jgi:hypothetical protein
MRGFAVLVQALAVVAGDDEQQPLRAPPLLDARNQATQLGVDERDLADIGAARECAREPRWRLVHRMGVVEVDPEEEARRRLAHPRQRGVHDAVGAALRIAHDAGAALAHFVVVHVEAAAQPEPLGQDDGPDKGRRGVTCRAHPLGEGRERFVQPVDRVVAYAVVRWVERRHQGDVSGERERRRRDGRSEANALRADGVQLRGVAIGRSVAAHVIGAQRVDRDEHDPLRRGLRCAPAARRHQGN